MSKFAACIFFLFFISINTQAYGAIDETIGKVVSLEGNMLYVMGEPLSGGDSHNIAVNISGAPMYDLITGAAVCTSFIRPEICVRIAYDTQKNAVAVWFNVGHKNAAVMSVVVSDNIQYGQGYCVFLTDCGKYRITLELDSVFPGQEYFVWVDMITASNPAIVYPDKVVLIDE